MATTPLFPVQRFETGDSGLHYVSGTTKIAGAPDQAVTRRAQLLRSVRNPVLVGEVYSDAAGGWIVENIAKRPAGDGYTAIAYDHTGTYDPVAKAGLVPTPMPPDPAEHP